MYLVRSGGARNYAVYDILLKFLQGTRNFVWQKSLSLQARVLVARGNQCWQGSSAD